MMPKCASPPRENWIAESYSVQYDCHDWLKQGGGTLNKRLYRSRTNSMLAGVAGGIGEYFEIDPTIVRLILVFLGALGFTGLFAYIIAWIVVPPNPDGPANPRFEKAEHWRESVYETARDVEQRFRKTDGGPRPVGRGSTAGTGHAYGNSASPLQLLGWILVILGAVVLLQKLTPWVWMIFRPLWPIALIVLGLVLIVREVLRR